MKHLITAILLATLAACGITAPRNPPEKRHDPSNLTPGIHVSGDVRVGVVKNF